MWLIDICDRIYNIDEELYIYIMTDILGTANKGIQKLILLYLIFIDFSNRKMVPKPL